MKAINYNFERDYHNVSLAIAAKESGVFYQKMLKDYDNEDIKEVLENELTPMVNTVYTLPIKPSFCEVERLLLATTDIVVVETDSGEYALALSACGMNYSEIIALAYMVLGIKVPEWAIPSQNMLLSKKSYKRLMAYIDDEKGKNKKRSITKDDEKGKNKKRSITKDDIMSFLRSDRLEELSYDDRMELFMSLPLGADDLSVSLFNEILEDYDSPLRVSEA